jgi:hypothetical protein
VTIAWKQEFRLFPTLRGYRRQWLVQDSVEELNSPLEGLIAVSTAQLQRTLATFCP